MKIQVKQLVEEVQACTLCEDQLPLGPRPVIQLDSQATILIAGQAPGIRVHNTGIPFNDPSGERLRAWMGIDKDVFYDPKKIALVPMGFCYPGTGKSGDLPPIPRCAEVWRERLLASIENLKLTLVIGQYSHRWHLKGKQEKTLTATVKNWQAYDEKTIPLPHPSPRNNIWLKKNPWFETDLLPELKRRVHAALSKT